MFEPIFGFLEKLLWQPRYDALEGWAAVPLRLARFLYAVVRDVLSGQLTLRAMSLVYTTMLSVVPLIAFSFSVLKGFDVHLKLEPLLRNFLLPLGEKGDELTGQVIGYVDNMRGDVLGLVGLGFLIVTVLSMVQKVEDSFNYVWRVQRPRSLARRFSEYVSVMLIGPVLMGFALGLTASIESTAIVQRFAEIEPFGTSLVLAGKLTPYVLVVVAFSFVYTFVPNTRVKLSSAMVGGLTAGVLWATVGALFTSFVVNSARTFAIYSGFAVVIVALIWLYLSWLILLLGAQIAFYYQNPEFLRMGRRDYKFGNQVRERLAVFIMSMVGRDFEDSEQRWNINGLATRLGLPAQSLAPVVTDLQSHGLLTETDRRRFMPGRALARIRIIDILNAVRQSADDEPPAKTDEPLVNEVCGRFESCLEQAFGDTTLMELLEQPQSDAPQPNPDSAASG